MTIGEKIGDLKRFDHIINVLFKYEFGYLLKKLSLKDRLTLNQRLQKEKFDEKKTQPYKLRKIFEELGGAFIKFAQFLSVRPDLIPISYVKEFEQLQTSAKPVPFEEIKITLETELKDKLKNLFQEFEEEPIASASIAQVHKAKLFSGQQVAVKIQRNNVQDQITKDIDLMNFFAELMQKHDYTIKGVNPTIIINEFRRWTEKELDFCEEANNQKIIKNNFSNDKNIIIPTIYEDYSTQKVLTMDFVNGTRLNDIEKIKEKKYKINSIIKTGFDAVLKQVFVDGFFHADPHPGNILVLNSNKLAFVDFGIVGIFNDKMKENSMNLFIGIMKNDVDLVLETLFDMGLDGDNIEILKIEIKNVIGEFENVEIKDVVISEVLEKLLDLIQKHDFKIPIDFILFGKTIMTLEGLALSFDPTFRLSVESQEFIKKIYKKKTSPKVLGKNLIESVNKLRNYTLKIPERTLSVLKRFKDIDTSLKYIDRDISNFIMEMDKSSNRITFGLIIAGLVIASTIMFSYNEITIMNISAFSFIGFLVSGLLTLIVIISMLREKRF
jgi:ubiquinone biosynthesis protein